MWRLFVGAGIVGGATESAALACAGLVHAEGDLAESDHASVLFEPLGGSVRVSYAAYYFGDAASFGWVIPVPGSVERVEDGDGLVFAELAAATAPAVDYGASDEQSAGCSCFASDKGVAGGARNDGFTVVDAGFTGTFEYVVLAATEEVALQAWFEENGWMGLEVDALGHYVDLGSTFVALRLDPQSSVTPSQGASLPPISITYAGEELRFPSVLASGTELEQRTTAYVLAETRAVVADGWTFEDGGRLPAGGADPSIAFAARLGVLGEDRAWLRTWAGPVELDGASGFVTRFDTFAPADVHDVDAVFGLEDSVEPLSTVLDAASDETSAAGLGLLALLGLGLHRRRNASVPAHGQDSRNSFPTVK